MIVSDTYQGKTIAVFGLARTGVAVVEALVAGGAIVLAWDDNAECCDQVASVAVDLYAADFSDVDYFVVAPGVPLTHPKPHKLVLKAQAAGVPVIGDFDLFAWAQPSLPPHKTVAITGTNGKSTTTALIHHMISSCGKNSVMAGNIGTGLMSLDALPSGGVYVLEMSSYQIDLTHDFRPDVTVLINVSPDHLDRHGDMAGYVAAKTRLFEMQETGSAVISIDDEYGQEVAAHCTQDVVTISVNKRLESGVYVSNGLLFEADSCETVLMGSVADVPTLKGQHNWQNAAAAFAVGRVLGLKIEDMIASFKSFPGLAHRQERITEISGVTYINDSKATNVDAAARALASFTNIHWIAGGRMKEDNIQALMPYMHHIKKAYLIGEAAAMMFESLPEDVDCSLSDTLENAVAQASANASPGDVILMSPACAAFDQFLHFEARGDEFRKLVLDLAEKAA